MSAGQDVTQSFRRIPAERRPAERAATLTTGLMQTRNPESARPHARPHGSSRTVHRSRTTLGTLRESVNAGPSPAACPIKEGGLPWRTRTTLPAGAT
jgi:hypothetical protein